MFTIPDPTSNASLLEVLRRLLNEIKRVRLQADELMGDTFDIEEEL